MIGLLTRQVPAIGKGGKVAQRLNKGHRLIVGLGFHLLQTGAPDGHLIQQPLAGGGVTALTADDHLLGETRYIRPEHGVQPQHRPLVHCQHVLERRTPSRW